MKLYTKEQLLVEFVIRNKKAAIVNMDKPTKAMLDYVGDDLDALIGNLYVVLKTPIGSRVYFYQDPDSFDLVVGLVEAMTYEVKAN